MWLCNAYFKCIFSFHLSYNSIHCWAKRAWCNVLLNFFETSFAKDICLPETASFSYLCIYIYVCVCSFENSSIQFGHNKEGFHGGYFFVPVRSTLSNAVVNIKSENISKMFWFWNNDQCVNKLIKSSWFHLSMHEQSPCIPRLVPMPCANLSEIKKSPCCKHVLWLTFP